MAKSLLPLKDFEVEVRAAFRELNAQFRAAAEQVGRVKWPLDLTDRTWSLEFIGAWHRIRSAECAARGIRYVDLTPDGWIGRASVYTPDDLKTAFANVKKFLKDGHNEIDKRHRKIFKGAIGQLEEAQKFVSWALNPQIPQQVREKVPEKVRPAVTIRKPRIFSYVARA
jgi:hypothetical protein